MTPINLECFRGERREWTITATKDGSPLNLTGATIKMSARIDHNADVLFALTVGDGVTITNPSGGIAKAKLRVSDTSVLPNDEIVLVYDVEVTTASDGPIVVSSGTITVFPRAGEVV